MMKIWIVLQDCQIEQFGNTKVRILFCEMMAHILIKELIPLKKAKIIFLKKAEIIFLFHSYHTQRP